MVSLKCVCVHACVHAYMYIHTHVHLYTCVYTCVYAWVCAFMCTHMHMCSHACVCVCVCMSVYKATQLPDSLSDVSTHSLYTHLSSQSARTQLFTTSDPPLRPSLVAPTWSPPPPWNTQTHQAEQTGGGTGTMECSANRWKMRPFICMARICLCFFHPLSQPRSSQLILPARRDQMGSRHAHPRKPNRLPIIF